MKTYHRLVFALVLIAGPLSQSQAAGPLGDSPLQGFGFGFDRERAQLREIAQTGLRHLLNFRQETPLSGEQKKEVTAVLERYRDEIRAQFQQGHDARRAMEAAVKEHGAEAPETLKAADEIGQTARDRALLTARVLIEIRPLLTPEQLERVEAARKELQSMVDEAMTPVQ